MSKTTRGPHEDGISQPVRQGRIAWLSQTRMAPMSSTFLLQRTSSRAVPPSVPSAAMVGRTVLVVEHETPVRAYLEQQLADDGFEVLATDRATAALELVEQARPSLVLLDAILPDASGFEVCSRLREGEPGRAWDRDVPVIMVSARGDPVDRVRGFARGCDDYVVRPSFALFAPIPVPTRPSARPDLS